MLCWPPKLTVEISTFEKVRMVVALPGTRHLARKKKHDTVGRAMRDPDPIDG